jgi:hypothetical protein
VSGPRPSQVGDKWDVTSLRPQQPRPELRSDNIIVGLSHEALDDIVYPEDASPVIMFSGIRSATGL